MLLLRLLTTGLCVACVVLLATFEPVRIELSASRSDRRSQTSGDAPGGGRFHDASRFDGGDRRVDRGPALRIVDVTAHVQLSGLPALVNLRPDEWISAINDQPLTDDVATGALLAATARAGAYLDLTVNSVNSALAERRVLVLMH